jgi:Ca2+-transporting ATPase
MAMTFVSLVLIQLLKAYNLRSDRNSLMQQPFANKWLNLAVLWELAIFAFIIYVPFLQKAFGTYDMTLSDWMIVLIPTLTISPVLEFAKWCVRKGWLGETD